MNIKPYNQVGSHRTGSLRGITKEQIQEKLGFAPNCKDDESKVKFSWGFLADGVHCGIWDYKGSCFVGSWSTFGPASVFKEVFGENYV